MISFFWVIVFLEKMLSFVPRTFMTEVLDVTNKMEA
jgi:hypothetical protein